MEYVINVYRKDLDEVFSGSSNLSSMFFPECERYAEKVEFKRTAFNNYWSKSVEFAQDFSVNFKKKTYATDFTVFEINGKKFVKIVTPFSMERSLSFIITKKSEFDEILWALEAKKSEEEIPRERKFPLIGVDTEELKKNSVDFLLNEEFRRFCENKDIPLKRGIVFEGQPGQGKCLRGDVRIKVRFKSKYAIKSFPVPCKKYGFDN